MVTHDRENLIATAKRESGVLELKSGAIVVYTGACTGRSPNAKFIVIDDDTADQVDWKNNQKISKEDFSLHIKELKSYCDSLPEVHIQNVYAGKDEREQIGLTVRNSKIWQALFANNMFVRSRSSYDPVHVMWDLYCFPEWGDTPKVLINFSSREITITGTHYAGEMKKSVFTVLNYILPGKNILPMHCSVNVGKDGKNASIFFGLSGTGKTTLSADSNRILVGDDEHGWSDRGLFNFEGGCYAKVINLSKTAEPEIWDAVQGPGAVLENVVISNDGIPRFDAKDHTENTRGSYAINRIPNASTTGMCGHPKNIVFLTCDAFGVLPPVAKLSASEAVQHFLMGYTAKVAGTEDGIDEPIVTFSHCFGAPFMPRPPEVYGELLREKVEEHNVKCWLVNTGWSGGAYGKGKRMPISVSRAVVNLILSGEMIECDFVDHSYTGLKIPVLTPNSELNNYIVPEYNWDDLNDYEATAMKLMEMWSSRLNELEK